MSYIYLISMLSYFILVSINIFLHLPSNLYIVLSTVIILLFLISSLYMTRGIQKYISIISLLLGHIILFKYNLGFSYWYDSISKGFNMVILFVVIPTIAVPLKYGNYLNSLEDFIYSKKEKPGILFSFLVIFYLSLAIPLNIGSIPTMQKLIYNLNFPKKYLTMLYTAGYSSYMVFSPFDGVVNMVLMLTSITYGDYFIKGLSMLITIILVYCFFLLLDKDLLDELKKIMTKKAGRKNYKKLIELMINVIILIALAFLSEKYIEISNSIYVLTILILIYSCIWMVLIKLPKNIWQIERKEYSKSLLSFKNFLPFLIGANFLGAMIAKTPFKNYIALFLTDINNIPRYFVIQILILLTVILSLCGVHMMITITTLAYTITPASIGLTNSSFALTLLTCWFMAMSISPFVPFASIVSESIGEKLYNITFKYNLKFAAALIVISPLIITLLNF